MYNLKYGKDCNLDRVKKVQLHPPGIGPKQLQIIPFLYCAAFFRSMIGSNLENDPHFIGK